MHIPISVSFIVPLFHFTHCAIIRFPSGVQTRTAVCLKTLSLMALICLRIGREMVQQHMADTLQRFFAVFTLLHSLKPQVCVHLSRESSLSSFFFLSKTKLESPRERWIFGENCSHRNNTECTVEMVSCGLLCAAYLFMYNVMYSNI